MSTKHFSNALIKSINDRDNHVISSQLAVVIKDRYPKAKYHYLVLPFADIPSIFNLNENHLALLHEMYLLALNIIEVKQETVDNFKMGFHHQPSLQRLHMHVLSRDFVSMQLKTKKHWNSFNTKLFLSYEEICHLLKVNGKIERLNDIQVQELIRMELKCNQCSFIAKNMTILKSHLCDHLNTKIN